MEPVEWVYFLGVFIAGILSHKHGRTIAKSVARHKGVRGHLGGIRDAIDKVVTEVEAELTHLEPVAE